MHHVSRRTLCKVSLTICLIFCFMKINLTFMFLHPYGMKIYIGEKFINQQLDKKIKKVVKVQKDNKWPDRLTPGFHFSVAKRGYSDHENDHKSMINGEKLSGTRGGRVSTWAPFNDPPLPTNAMQCMKQCWFGQNHSPSKDRDFAMMLRSPLLPQIKALPKKSPRAQPATFTHFMPQIGDRPPE